MKGKNKSENRRERGRFKTILNGLSLTFLFYLWTEDVNTERHLKVVTSTSMR
jgi:hypothetical protein